MKPSDAGGGGKSFKATSGHLFIPGPVRLSLRHLSCAIEILNDKRGVVGNSICIKINLVNSPSQNYRARNGCKAT